MSTPRPLCGFLLLALLAGSHAGQAQTSPQCANAPAPAGATLVKQGNGTAPGPSGGQSTYSQTPLNLSNYAVGGLLTVRITASNGTSAASFELFPGNTTFPANGAPSTRPLTSQANVAAGNCATLTYNFSQAGNFILAATGANGSNGFQYAAYVQPSFTGVFSPPPTTPQAPQNPGIFNGVFPPAQPTTPANPPPSTPPPAPKPQPASPAAPAPASPSLPASAPAAPRMIQTVWIQNSPGVPDVGGHCIICGLVRGSLTAVEPNLFICLTPIGATAPKRVCSPVCPPGHDCKQGFSGGVQLNGAQPAVHVEVLDNDGEGTIRPLATFDEKDASQCTATQPCKVDDADDQAAGTLVSFEFGTCATIHGPTALDIALKPNSPPAQPATPAPPGLADLPGPGFRSCCALGYALGLNPGALTGHKYGNHSATDMIPGISGSVGEPVGYVYTASSGIVDIGHVRDNADMTFWVYNQLANNNMSINVDTDTAWVPVVPCTQDEMLELAGSITFVSSWGHELGTWGETTVAAQQARVQAKLPKLTPEDFSAFSPEDLPSNIVGIEVATRAIKAGGYNSVTDFNTQVDAILPALLTTMGAQTQAFTMAVLAGIKLSPGDKSLAGKWWMNDPSAPRNGDVELIRRHFDGNPWPAPGNQVQQPGWQNTSRFEAVYTEFIYLMGAAVDARQVPETLKYADPARTTFLGAANTPGSLQWSPIPPGAVPSYGNPVPFPAQGQKPNINDNAGSPVLAGQYANVLVNAPGGGTTTILATMDSATQAIHNSFKSQNSGLDGP